MPEADERWPSGSRSTCRRPATGLLQGGAGARLGHEEPPRRHLPARRPHRDAGDRPRLLPGPDHRARAHRPVDRAAAAATRRAVLHARHPAFDRSRPTSHEADRSCARAAGRASSRSSPTSRSRWTSRTPCGSNAAGVGIQVFIGGEHETQSVHNMTRLVDHGLRARHPGDGRHRRRQGHGARRPVLPPRCRGSAPSSARSFVKTYYVDEDFETVTASCPVPIVMAGGKKLPELDALTMAYNAVQQGAAGVDMGRNIFQSDAPEAMMQAVRPWCTRTRSPDEAYELYEAASSRAQRDRRVARCAPRRRSVGGRLRRRPRRLGGRSGRSRPASRASCTRRRGRRATRR